MQNLFVSVELILIFALSGSEIYQEVLAKALARYYGAKLLIFDSHSFLGVRYINLCKFLSVFTLHN